MTREEAKKYREIKKAVEKVHLKPVGKRHGYKHISGSPYKLCGDMLYILTVCVSPDGLLYILSVKSVLLDSVFWEVFGITEEVKKQPFSFHINGAFTPYPLELKREKLPIGSSEEAESVLEEVFSKADKDIEYYCDRIKSISDFKNELLKKERVNKLNCMLCDIAENNFESALKAVEEELSLDHSGGFADTENGDIYNNVKKYCLGHLGRE